MFGPKKKPSDVGKKKSGVDVLIQKLADLPAAMDLMVAAIVGGYSLVAIFIDGSKFMGLVCIIVGLIFAMLGFNAVSKEMKAYKLISTSSTPDFLRGMKRKNLEAYLHALFSLDGYRVRTAIGELDRFDDVDLIAEKKDQLLFIQFNHFDEDVVDVKPIQSLHKAATIHQATGALVITFGRFSANAKDWAQRKEVSLQNVEDIIAKACQLTGISQEEAHPQASPEIQNELQHEIAEVVRGHHRYLFVDFAGIDHGMTRLNELLLEHPAYQVVASSIPIGKTLDTVREGLSELRERLIGEISLAPDGRYFAIQNYLQTTPEGKQSTWLALDSEPRKFPEGCTELIAINQAFGFDSSAAQRVIDAMVLVDRRIAADR